MCTEIVFIEMISLLATHHKMSLIDRPIEQNDAEICGKIGYVLQANIGCKGVKNQY